MIVSKKRRIKMTIKAKLFSNLLGMNNAMRYSIIVIIGIMKINEILNGVLTLSLAIKNAKAVFKSIATLEAEILTQLNDEQINPIKIFNMRKAIPMINT